MFFSHTLYKLGYINIETTIIMSQAGNIFFVIFIRTKEALAMAHIDKKNNQESKKTGKKIKKELDKGMIGNLMK